MLRVRPRSDDDWVRVWQWLILVRYWLVTCTYGGYRYIPLPTYAGNQPLLLPSLHMVYGDDTIYTVVFYLEYATSACYSSKVPLSDFFLVELTRCLRGTRRTRCELRLFPDMLVREKQCRCKPWPDESPRGNAFTHVDKQCGTHPIPDRRVVDW